MKKLLLFLLVIALLGGGALLYAAGKIQSVMEQVGTDILGVPVKVSKVRLNPLSGTVTLDALTVDNPQGYSRERKAFSFGKLTMIAEMNTLFSRHEAILIHRITVDNPAVTLEFSPYGSNLVALRQNIKRHFQPKPEGQPAAQTSSPQVADQPAAGQHEKRGFNIEHITFTEGSLVLASSFTENMVRTVRMPGFTMQNITSETGQEIAQALDSIVKAIVQNTAGQNQMLGGVEEKEKQSLKALIQRNKGKIGAWLSR